MPELHADSPILEGLIAGQCFTEHDGVRCYPAIDRQSGEKYIVKVVSVPANAAQTEALMLTGAIHTQEDAEQYFAVLTDETVEETRILNTLSEQDGFLGCLRVNWEKQEEAVGYEVQILFPYRDSLEWLLRKESLTRADALRLAQELCAALAACRQAGYLYVDLKPENIFRNAQGRFCIGDIGFVYLQTMHYASLPEKYRSCYTAPEMSDCMAQLSDSLDVFALGMILYQIFNGGTLPFAEHVPIGTLPAPLYADYELSAILMKACDPEPSKRWSDPMQFSQALSDYMQRNSVDASPIVPPPVAEDEEDQNDAPADEAQVEAFLPEMTQDELEAALAAEAASQDSDLDEIRSIAALALEDSVADVTLAEQEAHDASDEETAQMLAQAEELMALTPPEPVVAAEAVPVTVPNAEPSEPQEDTPQADADPQEQAEAPEAVPRRMKKKKKQLHWGRLIATVVILAVLCGLAYGGYTYYNDIYLQYIDAIQITGSDSSAVVTVISDIDESLLTLVCTDSYGNSHIGKPQNGKVTLDDLNPQTHYSVSIRIDGFHELRGETSAQFTTATQTLIHDFQAGIGATDGSVQLSFTASGPLPDSWTVVCTADGQQTLTQEFTGTAVTVSGLHVGSEYTFTLVPAQELYLSGQTQVQFTAVNILFAHDPVIDECHDGILHVSWSAPENESVASWTVRCYNAAGYDVTVTTEDTEYTFLEVDHSAATTVEITAVGMVKSVSTSICADPITVLEFSHTRSSDAIVLSWSFSGGAPEGGWRLRWSIDGTVQQTLACDTASIELPLLVPGGVYEFALEAADGTFLFNGSYALTAAQADSFSAFGLTASQLQLRTFRVPTTAKWSWKKLTQSDFTSEFGAEETIGVLLTSEKSIKKSTQAVTVTYILHAQTGEFLDLWSEQLVWNDMWEKKGCVLTPELPQTSGSYLLSIYFDGMAVGEVSFAIQ